MFKAGIDPKWENPQLENSEKGGKWTVAPKKKTTLESMWLETLFALIGEQFDQAEEICGVVVSVHQMGNRLSLWTKNAADKDVQVSIGKKWKEVIGTNDQICYRFHESAKSQYKVFEYGGPVVSD